MIRAATEQNEKLGVGLGPKESVAHCEPNLGPLSTSPCNLEAGECSNTLLGPLSSTPRGSLDTTFCLLRFASFFFFFFFGARVLPQLGYCSCTVHEQ